jgi:enterochelin esterase family protein
MTLLEVTSEILASSRKVWVEPPIRGSASDCLIFLDAEIYMDRVMAPEVIRDLQAAGRVPPITSIYLSYLDTAARHTDFTCNKAYSQFLAAGLRGWIERTVGHIERYFLCGLSLSGLSAAFTCLEHPSAFSGTLCQSPSAWWNDEWLAAFVEEEKASQGRYWISVGNQELAENVSHPPSGLFQKSNQLDSVRRLTKKLEASCKAVHYAEFSGGHDPACWGKELPDAISWLTQDT